MRTVESAHGYRRIANHFGIDPDYIIYCVIRDGNRIIGVSQRSVAEVIIAVVDDPGLGIAETTIGNPQWTAYEVTVSEEFFMQTA